MASGRVPNIKRTVRCKLSAQSAGEVQHGQPARLYLPSQFGVWFLRYDQMLCPLAQFLKTAREETADVWDRIQYVIPVGAIYALHLDVRIINPEIATFAD